MEFPETASVGRLSARRSSRQRKATSKTLADSPSLPSRLKKSKGKPKRSSSATTYFKVRDVLDERVRNGQLQYCIDWEDNPQTGESYTPTWEPRHHLTEQALLDWEEKKRKKNRLRQDLGRELFIPDSSRTPGEVSVLKRARSISQVSSDLSEPPEEKRPRFDTPEIESTGSVSQETVEEFGPLSENKNDYNKQNKLNPKGTELLVELPILDDFDRDAYVKVTTSSQISRSTQSQHQYTLSPQTPTTPRVDSGGFIVPDSQELQSSGSYVPSQTQQSSQIASGGVADSQLSVVQSSGPDLEVSSTEVNERNRNGGNIVQGSVNGVCQFSVSIDGNGNREEEPATSSQGSPVTASGEDLRTAPDLLSPSLGIPKSPPKESATNPKAAEDNISGIDQSQAVSLVPVSAPRSNFIQKESQDSAPLELEASQSGNTWSGQGFSQSSSIIQPSHQPSYQRGSYEESSLDFATQIQYSNIRPDDSREHQEETVERKQHLEGEIGREEQPSTEEIVRDLSVKRPQTEVTLSQNLDFGLHSELSSSVRVEADSLGDLPFQNTESESSSAIPESTRDATWQAAQPTSPLPQEPDQSTDQTTFTRRSQGSTVAPLSQIHFTELSGTAKPLGAGSSGSSPQVTLSCSLNVQQPLSQLHGKSVGIQERESDHTRSDSPIRSSAEEGVTNLTQEPANHLTGGRSENVLPSIECVSEEVSPLIPPKPSPYSWRGDYNNIFARRPLDIPDLRMDGFMSDEGSKDGPSMTITEMIKQARAGGVAAAEASRSVSALPSSLPVPEKESEDKFSPVGSIGPGSVIAEPAAPGSISPSPEGDTAPLVPLTGPNEYIVPLPMAALVRDVYRARISQSREDIGSFLNNEEVDPSLVEKMDKLIDDLQKISDHQDLISEGSATQLDPSHTAKWAETISTKCFFLRELLDTMSSFDDHVAVFVRSGQMIDILDALFKTNSYLYYRPDKPSAFTPTPKGHLRITLMPTSDEGPRYSINSASTIIAFDETFEKQHYLKVLQAGGTDRPKPVCLISLVVTNSPQHFELCIPKAMEVLERKTLLVNGITEKRKEIGHLEAPYPQPEEAAKAVATFLTADSETEWPLPAIPQIEDVQLLPEGSQSLERREQLLMPISQPLSPLPQLPHSPSSFKRSGSLNAMETESAKRQRLISSFPNPRPSSLEPSLLGQGISKESHANSSAIHSDTNQIGNEEQQVNEEQSPEMSILQERIASLQQQLEARESSEQQLRQQNSSLELRVQDHENMIRRIQPKYQEALNECGQALKEKDAAVARYNTLLDRLEARNSELARLKEEKQSVENELAATRGAMLNNSDSLVAENGRMREQIRSLQDDNTKLQARLANLQNDFDFMRSKYQEASHEAAESAREIVGMKETISQLQHKASVNVPQLQHSYEIRQLMERVDELELIRVELQRELDKKVEELRVRMNGRRETRGTSVPRSPRMGAGTMSPRPVARVIGQSTGVGSRGNSPVAAGWDPVRSEAQANNWTSGGPVTARWPTHLQ